MSDYFTRLQEQPFMALLTQQDVKSYLSALTAVIVGFVLIYFAFFNSNRQQSPEKKGDTKDEKSQFEVKERGISPQRNEKETVDKTPSLLDVTQKSLSNAKQEVVVKKDDKSLDTINQTIVSEPIHSNGSFLYEFQATEALTLLANQNYCLQLKNATVNQSSVRRIIHSETPKRIVMRNVKKQQGLEISKNEETKKEVKEKQLIPEKGMADVMEKAMNQEEAYPKEKTRDISNATVKSSEPIPDALKKSSKQDEAVNENKTVDPVAVIGAIATGAGILEASREICATKEAAKKDTEEANPAAIEKTEEIPVDDDANTQKDSIESFTVVENEKAADVAEDASKSEASEDRPVLVDDFAATDDKEDIKKNDVSKDQTVPIVDQKDEKPAAEPLSEPEIRDIKEESVDHEIAEVKEEPTAANTVEAEKSLEADMPEEPTEEKEVNKDVRTAVEPVTTSAPVAELPVEDNAVISNTEQQQTIEPVALPEKEEEKEASEDFEMIEHEDATEDVAEDKTTEAKVENSESVEPDAISEEQAPIKEDTAIAKDDDDAPEDNKLLPESESIPVNDAQALEKPNNNEKGEVANNAESESTPEATAITENEIKEDTDTNVSVSDPIPTSQEQHQEIAETSTTTATTATQESSSSPSPIPDATEQATADVVAEEEEEEEQVKEQEPEEQKNVTPVVENTSAEKTETASADTIETMDTNNVDDKEATSIKEEKEEEKTVESVPIPAAIETSLEEKESPVSTREITNVVQDNDELCTVPETTTVERNDETSSAAVEDTTNEHNVDISEKESSANNDTKEEESDKSVNVIHEPITQPIFEPKAVENNVYTPPSNQSNFDTINLGYHGQDNYHMYAYPKMVGDYAAVPSMITPSSQPREKRYLSRLEKIDRQMQSYAPRMKARCTFWPNCTNKNCKYWHPIKECRMGQNCTYGNRCMFLHPNDIAEEQPRRRKAKLVNNKP